jgi:hypothetical protein
MISVRRLNTVGAGLALVVAVACTAVWGDATGSKSKPSALATAIHTPQETGALSAADNTGGRFSGKPVITYETLNGELHFALQLKPRLPDAPARARDIAVVIDTSASQVGNPLKNARLVLEEVVKSAKPSDRIAVWTVNTPDFTRDLSGGLQPASGDRVKEALAGLKREYAAGATDLKDGLKKILRGFPVAADRQQVVLYLGDGESPLNPLSDSDRSALAADMVSRSVTFFAVPLGVRLDPKNLHGLTSASGGAVVRKLSGDQPAEFVRRLEGALATPVFYPSTTKPAKYSDNVGEALPARLPPLRGDAPTLVVGLLKPSKTLGLQVEGTVAGKPFTVDLNEQVPPADVGNYFLVHMVRQWSKADRTAPALVRADRGLALAFEQTRLDRDEYLTQAQWALSQNKLDAAQKLFSAAQSINPRDTEAGTGLKVVAGLKDGRITREQLKKELSDPKAIAMKIEKGGDDTRLVKLAMEKLALQNPPEPATADAPSILQLERSRQRVQEQQITQVVDDTIKRARQMLNTDPDAAYELLKRQLTSVRENTELSDAVRATLASRLEAALRSSVAEGARVKQAQEAALQQRIADEARRSMESSQRSDEERIRERVRAFSSLMNQARFEEAYKEALVLQQEQMAKGRPVPVQANAAYFMATNAASLREFEELRRIKEDRYMLTMLQVDKSHVPFPDEPPVAFPPAVTWRELSNYRRDKYDAVGLEGPNTRNALRIRDKLNQTVDVQKEIDNTPLKDVLSFLSDKYDVTFIVDVQAFDRDNANRTVEDSPVRLPKMPGVSLGTILRFVLAQVQGTYLIRRDYIEITTNNASIAEKAVRAYPVADLVIPIPNSVNQQALNQNLQVLGSSLSANGMAIFGAVGGNGALGFAGPLGALGTLGALGALGGVSGAAAIGVIGGAGGVVGGGASGSGFSGALGFAGGNNQTNQGFGGGVLGFGGGQQGQFGNLGGQFGIQGGNTSGILIELIKDVIAPKEWNDRAARYLFNNINTQNPDDDQPILNPDLLNSMGYYQPSNALVVRGTSRLHTRIGGGNIGSAGGGGVRMGAAPKGDKGDALVIAPGQNRDKNNGGVGVAKAPAAPKVAPKVEVAIAAATKKDRDPKQAWEEAVEKGYFRPRQVIAVADLLAHFEKFDEVAELLKADLRHGVLAQPCCFDALAIALKQCGGTIEEIERIRLSQIDLEPTNPQSYLRAAEAMNELGRPEQAVAFCKRAAGIEPNATDPYAQSLVYLDKAKAVDTDAVQWAAANLSSRDWAINDPTNMADAKKALADLVAKLNAAGRKDDATRIAALASPSRHDLAIEATWGNEADVDLAVIEPIGSVCSNQNRQTVGGGRWRGDRLMSKDNDRFSENYTATEAFSGTYEIKLTRVWGKPLGDKVTVKVTTHDGTDQKREEWHRLDFGTDGIATLKVQLDDGRRTVAATVPPPAPRTPPVVARDPDRVFNLLRAMAEPAYAGMAKQHMAAGGTSAAGTLNSQVMNSAVDLGPEVYHQNTIGSGTGADLVGQAVVSSDRRSVRVTAAPVFQTATAQPEVNLSLIPGGK